ncbi:isoprenylcysteine carboxylmethyltransferase family protein, partial [Acinetobacter baumannii]
LTQVVWFIWVAALVQLFDELRLHGVLPSLFSWF